jgi:hypothetical protein
MLRGDDLTAAIEAGLITRAQAHGLENLAASRRKSRAFALGREERFRLLGGFNDFFIALGVVMLGIGFWLFPTMGGSLGVRNSTQEWLIPVVWALGLAVFWGLAEVLTGRLKLVAPSIAIVAFLAIFAAYAGLVFGGMARGAVSYAGPLCAVGLVALHYARFRLPFSLFVLAFSGVALALTVAMSLLTQVAGLPDAAAAPYLKWIVLVLGLATFAWAMTFDVSDPERTTRRADCGFWLHLVAAPLIVHPLAGPLINHPLLPDYARVAPLITSTTVMLVLALVLALSIVALVVDRRALLVAGLGYLGSALAYTMAQLSGASVTAAVLPTLAAMGVLIIALGVGWREIRAAVMATLPDGAWKTALPPYGKTP